MKKARSNYICKTSKTYLIRKLYLSGLSLIEIAKLFNCHYSTIFYWLKKMSVERRVRWWKNETTKSGRYDGFEIPLSENESWVLGLIATDGCIAKSPTCKYPSTIVFTSKDEELVDKVKTIVPIFRKYKRKDSAFELECGNKELASKLMALGITPRKTFTLQPPPLDAIQISHYVRGLMDGDGSIYIGNKKQKTKIICAKFITASEMMFKFIKNLMINIVNHSPAIWKQRKTYHILLNGKWALKWLDWIYKDSSFENRLERKYKIYQFFKQNQQKKGGLK